jgi:hypothetical protein
VVLGQHGEPAPGAIDVTNSGIAQMLDEAKELANDPRVTKSESGRVLTVFLLRLVETLAEGAPKSTLPPKHHE